LRWTTTTPMPLEDFDFEAEVGGSVEESGESEESEAS
jgi:hypothetical protein